MIRTKIQPKTPQLPSGLMGGYMPDPPEDCIKRKEYHPKDERWYINTVICRDCKKNPCNRRMEFLQEWKTYRAWLKDNQ